MAPQSSTRDVKVVPVTESERFNRGFSSPGLRVEHLTRFLPQLSPQGPFVAVCAFPFGLPLRASKELLVVA